MDLCKQLIMKTTALIYLFVQVWLGAIVPSDYFVIHGLWPEYPNGSWPEYCNKNTATFNVTELAPIMPELLEYWPGLNPNTTLSESESFWRHEYLKHGECMANKPEPLPFFKLVLNLRENYSMLDMLQGINVVPTNSNHSTAYQFDSVVFNFIEKYGIAPILQCKNQSLNGVVICIDSSMNAVNCTNDVYSSFGSSCLPQFRLFDFYAQSA